MSDLQAELQLKSITLPLFLSDRNVLLPLHVQNTGHQTWLAQGQNPVCVSYHWLMADRSLALRDGLRSVLPRDLAAGETADIQATIAVPATPGHYILQLTLVQEGVTWFEKVGFKPLELPLQIYAPEHHFAARLSVLAELPSLLYPNEVIRLPLRVMNTSPRLWLCGGDTPVHVTYHWLNADRSNVVRDGLRAGFAEDIKAGDDCVIAAQIQAPDKPGQYCLQLTLVQELVAWFEQYAGFQMPELLVEVVDAASLDKAQQRQQQTARAALAKAVGTEEHRFWIERHDTLAAADILKIRIWMAYWPRRPLISVIMPTYNTPPAFLRAAIESVQQQIYPDWELCIADDASTDPQVREILQEYAAREARIKLCFVPSTAILPLPATALWLWQAANTLPCWIMTTLLRLMRCISLPERSSCTRKPLGFILIRIA